MFKKLLLVASLALPLAALADSAHECQGNADCSSGGDVTVTNVTVSEAYAKALAALNAKIQVSNQIAVVEQEAADKRIKYSGKVRVDNNVSPPDASAVTTAVCRVGFSGSGSGGGVGLGFGGSTLDEGCDTRADALLLHQLGHADLALMRLCAKAEMAAVIPSCAIATVK